MTMVQQDYQKRDFCQGHDIRTSDVYKTENLPYRFEYPSRWNYGNCVFTPSENVAEKCSVRQDFDSSLYRPKASAHLFFRTTNSDYGSKPPCIHTMPHTYHPRNHKYWEHLAKVGMYRNCGFNTGIDRNGI